MLRALRLPRLLAELPNAQTVMTAPNADPGALAITAVLERRAATDRERFKLVKNLGHDRFVSFLREAWAMVGNSSAGIVEAPAVQLPVVNIGARQRGRQMPRNIITVDALDRETRSELRSRAWPRRSSARPSPRARALTETVRRPAVFWTSS